MPAIDSGGGHIRLRLDIAYDGTDFTGWAAQNGQRTVAGVLEETLSTVFRTPVLVQAAGRTDAGVHASGQVAHLDLPAEAIVHAYPRKPRPADPEFQTLVRRLGRFLPDDVRVRQIVRAAPGFDARFSALRRHYVYRISTAHYGVEPERARYVAPWPRPLDVDAMNAAAQDLLGLHDFAAFCRYRDYATTIRDLQRLEWTRDGDLITASVTADAFCWNMVRSVVGALTAVGERRRSREWVSGLLDFTRRSSDYSVAPAKGLTMTGVDYPPDHELESRTLVTKVVRAQELPES